MDTAYINHTNGVSAPAGTGWYLYQNRLAAMHYDQLPIATDPSEFAESSTAKSVIESFREYVQDGYIVGVRNNMHPQLTGGMLVGSIGPVDDPQSSNNPIRLLISRPDSWNCSCNGPCTKGCAVISDIPIGLEDDESAILHAAQNHDSVAADVIGTIIELRDAGQKTIRQVGDLEIEYEPNEDGDAGSINGVTLMQAIALNKSDTHWRWYRNFPYFATIRHQGVTANWNTGSKQLLAAYNQEDNRLNTISDGDPSTVRGSDGVDLLSPQEIETLCTEYLRSDDVGPDYPGYTHEYPVGGSLTAADSIAQTTDGTQVISQVTKQTASASKLRKLASYAARRGDPENIDLWYFGKGITDGDIPADIEITIHPKPIEEVFEEMANSVTLSAMLEVPPPKTEPADTQPE